MKTLSQRDYTQARNENILREFFARIGTGKRIGQIILDIAAHAHADRFYIGEERAQRLVSLLRRRGDAVLDTLTPTRREMILEIDRRVTRLLDAFPAMTFADAVFTAVNSPAPSFYLTPRSLRTILYASRSFTASAARPLGVPDLRGGTKILSARRR